MEGAGSMDVEKSIPDRRPAAAEAVRGEPLEWSEEGVEWGQGRQSWCCHSHCWKNSNRDVRMAWEAPLGLIPALPLTKRRSGQVPSLSVLSFPVCNRGSSDFMPCLGGEKGLFTQSTETRT